jgi:mannose-6-phosphate isomerase-like protein (cupin superfamily)
MDKKIDIKNYGGNAVKQFQLGKLGKEMLGAGPYEYYIYETQESEAVKFSDLRSFSVYIFHKSAQSVVTVDGVAESLEQGDRVQSEDCAVHVNVQGGSVKFLVAGTSKPHPEIKGLFFTRAADLYKVEKPWGHELWINGQHPCYAFKEIFIKAGTKTSLQYHKFKQETNVLFQGTAKLHYKNNANVMNDLVTAAETADVQIEPISSVDVMPSILHRLEAVTDILLYETSTPHFDDVVRVQDDNQRTNGRIEKEHTR